MRPLRSALAPTAARTRIGLVALLVPLVAGLFFGATRLGSPGTTEAVEITGMVVAAAGVYLVCTTEPVYLFTIAIVLTPFASNWQQLHVPGQLAPDRLLFIAGTAIVLFRAYVLSDLPRPKIGIAHAAMAAAAVFAGVSALKYGTLTNKGPALLLVETFGILPFVTFWLGPVVFPTRRERAILLFGLVVMAAYLGLTTLFETVGPKALVFPRYIVNSSYGIQIGRGRGPFADAVANGVGLYVGAVASVIAAYQWKRPAARVTAAAIAILCLAGTIMTLERSVWIAAGAATCVALLASRRTRRIAIPTVAAVAAVTAITVFAVPGLHHSVSQRVQSRESVYDRQNLENTALNMIQARPLLGFGWSKFLADHTPYIRQLPNVPLTDTTGDVHSAYLTYAVDLGLVGAGLWLLAILLGAGATALAPVPDELEPWRIGLVALLVFFLIGEAFVPPTVFVNASLWLWAGVVAVARYPAGRRARRTRSSARSEPPPVLFGDALPTERLWVPERLLTRGAGVGS
jgi:hypothetical protein